MARHAFGHAPVRVLHLLSQDEWGGTEIQVAELVRRSDGERCHHGIAVLEPRGELHRRLRDEGLEIHPLHGRGGAAGVVGRLAKVLLDGNWDVLEAYGFRAALSARAAMLVSGRRPRLLIGVRGVHFAEGEDPSAPRTRGVLRVERALGWTTTGYDANSQGARDFLISQGFAADKFSVIPNGVVPLGPPSSATVGRPRQPLVVVCVARFVPRKRQSVLVDAIATLAATGRELRCEFVGAGPTLGEVRSRAESRGLAACVEFAGRLEPGEVRKRLHHADAFVLPSLWEGLPGSVIEAMTARLPVIATDVSGTREVVVHGETGLLVPPDDAPALAAALGRLIDEPELAAQLGQAGLERSLKLYSLERLVAAKESYFVTVAGRA